MINIILKQWYLVNGCWCH